MKLFDEYGNYIGEFVENSVDNVTSSYQESFGAGCAAVLIALVARFPILIVLVILFAILWLLWAILKLALKIIWWLLRMPFTLIFRKEFPEF